MASKLVVSSISIQFLIVLALNRPGFLQVGMAGGGGGGGTDSAPSVISV